MQTNREWRRVGGSHKCPICRKSDWCEIGSDGVVHCMRVPSDTPIDYRGGGWLHGDCKADYSPYEARQEHKPEDLPPIEILTEMNQRLLLELPLTDEHRALIGKVDPALCGSFSRDLAMPAGQTVAQYFEMEHLLKNPALKINWIHIGDKLDSRLIPVFEVTAYQSGIFFAVHNERTGHIPSITLRKDNPGDKNKYAWVSRDGLSGTPFCVLLGGNKQRLIITEGIKKSYAARAHFGCQVIGLGGVTSYDKTALLAEIDALQSEAPGNFQHFEIVIAFDRDKHEKPQVKRAEQRLLQFLAKNRPALRYTVLDWNRGKGVDDAIEAGAEFTFTAAEVKQARYVTGLPAESLAQTFPNTTPLYTLEQARVKNRDLADRVLWGDCLQIANTSVTGSGKSRSADEAAVAAVLNPRFTKLVEKFDTAGNVKSSENKLKRVLLLCPDKANVLERTAPHTALGKLLAGNDGVAAIQFGRDLKDEQSEFHCHNQIADRAGRQRHAPGEVACKICVHGSLGNWQRANPGWLDDYREMHPEYDDLTDKELEEKAAESKYDPRPPGFWDCTKAGYLASRARSKAARLVVATKQAYLNNGIDLKDFDAVIVDEDLRGLLLERITITSADINEWRTRTAYLARLENSRVKEPALWDKFFNLLQNALNELPGIYPEPGRLTQLYPAMPALEQAARNLLFPVGELDDLPEPPVRKTLRDKSGEIYDVREDHYPFEEPHTPAGYLGGLFQAATEEIIPLKAVEILLKAISPQGGSGLNLKAQRAGDSFVFIIYRTRDNLLELLPDRALLVLDATMPPTLKMMLPDLQEVAYSIPQYLEITQTTNALYSSGDLENPKTREAIEAVGLEFFKGCNTGSGISILPKRFRDGEKALHLPSVLGHWGKDHKATNAFTDFSHLLLVGHYEPPIDTLQAELDAIRGKPGNQDGPTERLRLFNCLLPDNTASGMLCKSNPDRELQAAIEHEYYSNIVQAIGRLRPALKSPEQPAQVLLLCNEPAGALPVTRLTTVNKIVSQGFEATKTTDADFTKFLNIYITKDCKNGICRLQDTLLTQNTEPAAQPEPQPAPKPEPTPTSEPQPAVALSVFARVCRDMIDSQPTIEGVRNVLDRVEDTGRLIKPEEKKYLRKYASAWRQASRDNPQPEAMTA